MGEHPFAPDTVAALAQIGREPDEVAAALDAHLRRHPQSDEFHVAERPRLERRPNDPAPTYLRDVALQRRRVEGDGWAWAVAAPPDSPAPRTAYYVRDRERPPPQLVEAENAQAAADHTIRRRRDLAWFNGECDGTDFRAVPTGEAADVAWRAGLVADDVAAFLAAERVPEGRRGVVTFVADPLARGLVAWHQIDGVVRSEAAPLDGPTFLYLLTCRVQCAEEAVGGLYPYAPRGKRGRPWSARRGVAEAIRRRRAEGDGYLVVALVAGETLSVMYDAPEAAP